MRRALLLMPVLILTQSCAETTRGSECMAFRPITVEDADQLTPETARLILGHNRAFRAVCGD